MTNADLEKLHLKKDPWNYAYLTKVCMGFRISSWDEGERLGRDERGGGS
jgi:hypothetical protein